MCDAAALLRQVVVDRAELARHIRQALQERSQISLAELVTRHPLRQGLAELVVYLQLAGGRSRYGGGRGNDRVADLAARRRQLSPRPFAAHYFCEEMT